MRLTNDMNFPHPVLAEWRSDFTSGQFNVDISYRENQENNQLVLHIDTVLECPEIEELISNGGAQLGCFVACVATGYRRLIEIGRPACTYNFKPGDLLDNVVIRPIVWATKGIQDWCPTGIHEEFSGGHDVSKGGILAMADAQSVQVGKANLPPLETIFQLSVDDTMKDGEFGVDMDAEKITILAPRETYDLVETLRASGPAPANVVMNALYIPCVMRVLAQVATDDGEGNFSEFENRRWVTAFQRRCESLDIGHRETDILENAQKLLEYPFSGLAMMAGEG